MDGRRSSTVEHCGARGDQPRLIRSGDAYGDGRHKVRAPLHPPSVHASRYNKGSCICFALIFAAFIQLFNSA